MALSFLSGPRYTIVPIVNGGQADSLGKANYQLSKTVTSGPSLFADSARVLYLVSPPLSIRKQYEEARLTCSPR